VHIPDHAQIQPLQPYLFVIVLLIKLHYRMVLHFFASRSFITVFRLAVMFVSTVHLPNKQTLQILPVPAHTNGALRSLYTDSEVLYCDWCELNILLFAMVGNNQHG